MRFRLQLISTSIVGGTLEETMTISDEAIRNISPEETVGDEFFTKATAISIETREPLIVLEGFAVVNWLVLYLDDVFYNVYKHPLNYISFDEKLNIYKYRCDPIQKIFYDDIAATAI